MSNLFELLRKAEIMMRQLKLGVALAAVALFTVPSLAKADLVLNLDLTVENQITITALDGLSEATVSAPTTGIGFYMEGAMGGTLGASGDTLVGGDLTSFGDASDGTPDLFSFGGDAGLNVFSYAASSSFTTGVQAFEGAATWDLTPEAYADLLAGADAGDVWFEADSIGDLATASIVGQYIVKKPGGAIPEPTSLALIGLGCVGLAFRRSR